ncbi:MAG TPA: serine hydrolase domain-containing protein [Blastocatellia bacterium]|nr:serine hydrolase domain-containing protein [Blastocatellia bacterium]
MKNPWFSLRLTTVALAVACLSFFGICATAQTGDTETIAKVDKIFAQFDKPDSPGCALAVIKDAQIIYKRGYGMADLDHDIAIKPDTPFHVASVSKQFTAFSILLLAQQGKLSLDDKVQKYITELREFDQPITIRHLLHHTSGLRDQWNLLIMSGTRLGEDVVRDDDVLDLVSRMKELNFKPGDQHLYSNTGYTLLAFIVKRVSGQSLREFAEANIFKPLGMTRTVFRDDHSIIVKHQAYAYNGPSGSFKLSVPNYDTVGASSLMTTVEDLAKWDQNFYDKKVGGDWVIEQMQIRGQLNNGEQLSYARGVTVGTYKGLKVIEHSGGDAGYRSHLMRFPDQRFSVACLCNYGGTNPSFLARQVADVYLAKEFAAPPPKPASPTAAAVTLTEQELNAKVGAYWDARLEEVGRISLKDGKLQLSVSGLNAALVPVDANRFRVEGQPLEVVFESSAQGVPAKMSLSAEGRSLFTYVPMPPADTTKLSEYEGTYYSEEIDSTYRVLLKDGKLTVTRKKFGPTQLTPAFRDGFTSLSILGTFRFTRDAQNRVNGFRLSAGRIRNFRFVKQ